MIPILKGQKGNEKKKKEPPRLGGGWRNWACHWKLNQWSSFQLHRELNFSHSWSYPIHPLWEYLSGRQPYQHPLPLHPPKRLSLILPHRNPLLHFLLPRSRRRHPFLAFPTLSSSSVSLGGDPMIWFSSSIGLLIPMSLGPVNWIKNWMSRKRKFENGSSGEELVIITRRKEAFSFCSFLPIGAPCSIPKQIMIRRFKNMILAIFRECFLCSL